MRTQPLRYEDLTDEDFTPEEAVTVVESWADVPRFKDEEEAARWWDTHSLADALWSKDRRGPPARFSERARAERVRRQSRELTLPYADRLYEMPVFGLREPVPSRPGGLLSAFDHDGGVYVVPERQNVA